MPVMYDEKQKVFNISTKSTSYVCGLVDDGVLVHLGYGKKIKEVSDFKNHIFFTPRGFSATDLPNIPSSTDVLPQEYPCFGSADLRTPAFHAVYEDGSTVTKLRYKSHKIIDGKPCLNGLPATYTESDNEAQTLIITMTEALKGIEVNLYYTAFYDYDVIARHTEIVNNGNENISILSAMSCCVDFHENNYEFLHLQGTWTRERHIERVPLIYGNVSVDSKRGASSHFHNPFFALVSKNADEDNGDAYGFNLVYSGNFVAGTEVNAYNISRAYLGINPFNFCWQLGEGETFVTPEAVLTYSAEGIGQMSRNYHKIFRKRLARGKYRDSKRPVLINNWEATYFEFNEEKIVNIAKKAKEMGVELMVLDDGWFGKRDLDDCSLGDWVVDKNKLPNGLEGLVKKINDMGMTFGLWFEPEMVSPDSELYKAHPDWAIQVKGRELTLCREQYVLDYSRKDVRDYVYSMMRDILDNANIEYIKWDMNRQLTEVGSNALPANRQRELWHRYVLGVYELMDRLTTDYPHILLENCSGGGARFDAGMLYYSPQIWCSDDTDAIERLKIQHGTSMVYPCSAMGAHVSDCPNHTVGRNTPFRTRGHVAMVGTFGYELDVTKIPQTDRDAIPGQIAEFNKYNALVRTGDHYRIGNVFENIYFDAWMFVAKDKSEALLEFVQVLSRPNERSRRIKLKGLDKDAVYQLEGTEFKATGKALMTAGFNIKNPWGDYQSEIFHFVRV